jgi:co-chaperonin GroES (HSP10)
MTIDINKLKLNSGQPAGFRVLVKILESENTKQAKKEMERAKNSGIVLAKEAEDTLENEISKSQTTNSYAEVISIGRTAFKAYDDGVPWCEIGDVVLIATYAGKASIEEGILYRTINDEDIIHVWKKGEDF